ncbi:unnamed protein product [Gongylonema pulchrum]|uniref:Glycosyl transferase n=1 Tax=Gongylonema pulchrum TaxID=637853 RepID=A0A183DLU8_9BILA|nr:unnamed protein product [Gongylonema pulchrum]
MKSMLHDCELFYRIHNDFLKGSYKIKETELLKITSSSREVHFIRSPLLLFPKWRRLVALARKASENAVR